MDLVALLEVLRDMDSTRDRIINMIEGEAKRIDRNNKGKDPTDTEKLIHQYSASRGVMLYRHRIGRELGLSLEDSRNAFN